MVQEAVKWRLSVEESFWDVGRDVEIAGAKKIEEDTETSWVSIDVEFTARIGVIDGLF